MAGRIYNDGTIRDVSLNHSDFDIDKFLIRFWTSEEYIYPLIAKGNRFDGVEALW